MSTQIQETDHAKEQAKAQLESIIEMVAALNREDAIGAYIATKTDDEIQVLAGEAEVIEPEDENPPVEALRERLIAEMETENYTPSDFEFDEEEARERIQEDPLSVQVRSGWYSLGDSDADKDPAEFEILLCTGGPAVRIVGDLDRGSPDRPRIEYQDWGTPWTEYFPEPDEREALQTYCEQFYFGD